MTYKILPYDLQTVLDQYQKRPTTYFNDKQITQLQNALLGFKFYVNHVSDDKAKQIRSIIQVLQVKLQYLEKQGQRKQKKVIQKVQIHKFSIEIKKNWKLLLGVDFTIAIFITILTVLLAIPQKLGVFFEEKYNWFTWLIIIFICSFIGFGIIILLWQTCRCSWCPKCPKCPQCFDCVKQQKKRVYQELKQVEDELTK